MAIGATLVTNTCLFCHKPVENDVKELLAFDSMGEVVKRLCHRERVGVWL